jgi:hypothetical protein
VEEQPHPIADLKLSKVVFAVLLCLHQFLGMKAAITNFCQEVVLVHEQSRLGEELGTVDRARRRPEWCGLEHRLVGRIVAVLFPWQPAEPARGPVAGETTEADAQNPIGYLGLAVGLQVEQRAEQQCDVDEGEQLRPKCAGEHRVPVTDDGAEHAMEPHNVVEKGAGDHDGV